MKGGNLITSYNARLRSLGDVEDTAGVIIEYEFRDALLAMLKGAPLSVFLCISLHSDLDGHCYLSYETIMKETGYNSRTTISAALSFLLTVTINGEKLLHQYRERESDGTFLGSNHYRIFPDRNEPETYQSPESVNQSPENGLEVVSVNTEVVEEVNTQPLTVQKVDSGQTPEQRFTDKHPAFQVYLQSGGGVRTPRRKLSDGRTQRQKYIDTIAEAVGDNPDDLEFWGKVVRMYAEDMGWSSFSYFSMLEYFEKGALPPNKNKRVRWSRPAPSIANEQEEAEKRRQDAIRRMREARAKKVAATEGDDNNA